MMFIDGTIVWELEELEEARKVMAWLDKCRATRNGENVCMGVDASPCGVESECRSCQFWAGYDRGDDE